LGKGLRRVGALIVAAIATLGRTKLSIVALFFNCVVRICGRRTVATERVAFHVAALSCNARVSRTRIAVIAMIVGEAHNALVVIDITQLPIRALEGVLTTILNV